MKSIIHVDSYKAGGLHDSKKLFPIISDFMNENGEQFQYGTFDGAQTIIADITQQVEDVCGLVTLYMMSTMIAKRFKKINQKAIDTKLYTWFGRSGTYNDDDMNTIRKGIYDLCLALEGMYSGKEDKGRSLKATNLSKKLSAASALTSLPASSVETESSASKELPKLLATTEPSSEELNTVSALFSLKTTRPSAGASADSRPSYSLQAAVLDRKQKLNAKRRQRYEVNKQELKQQKAKRMSDHYKQFCDEDCKEEIEWWDGDIQDGGFVSGFRHSWEKEVTFYLHGKERKKRSEKGCIVAKKSSPWIFEFIRCERIKYKQPITVLWGTFSSQQLTPPICFSTAERNEKNGRCLVRWNNDKRWLFPSEFSSVTQSVKRNTAPPNRLSTDEDGKLVFNSLAVEGPSNDANLKRVITNNFSTPISIEGHTFTVAYDAKVDFHMRKGDVDSAINEVIELQERSRDESGRPLGLADTKVKKIYNDFNQDIKRKSRLKVYLLYQLATGKFGRGATASPALLHTSTPALLHTSPLLTTTTQQEKKAAPKQGKKRRRKKSYWNVRKKKSKKNQSTNSKCIQASQVNGTIQDVTVPRIDQANNVPTLPPIEFPSVPTLPPIEFPSWQCRHSNCERKATKNNLCSVHGFCAHAGCKNKVVTRWYPYCCDHKVKEKKVCVICKTNESRRHGGLCRSCFNKKYPPEQLQKMKLCNICNLRLSKKVGGKCDDCIKIKM